METTPVDRLLQAAAAQMRAAQRLARQIEPFSARVVGFDLSAGYAVAALVVECTA